MMSKHLFFIISCLIFNQLVRAQYTVTGSTVQSSCSEFVVTPDNPNLAGSFYKNASVSLNTDFNLMFSVNFGCDNFGGSGLVFVLRNGPWAVGTGGAGMGYQGMTGNSMGVEFDTRDDDLSLSNGDIPADHMGLFKAGSTNHNPGPNNLSGNAINISSSAANVEDCQTHLVEIIWDYIGAGSQTITINVDGDLRITETGDFINTAFAGNPTVLWGWTGATSTVNNEQIVGLALEPNFTISATNCPGQLINFTDASFSQNPITTWLWDFDGLGTSGLPNPSFTFMNAGTYNVDLTITDNTGCSNTATIEVGVGFDVAPTTDASPVCPGTSTTLHANAAPYVGNTCCFDLILGDLWDDGWQGNTLEVTVNGVPYGSYSPAIQGLGQAYYETINLCFDVNDVIEFTINGAISPGEPSYELLDAGGNTIIYVPPGVGSWINGAVETYTVNCGIAPPAYTYVWDNGASPANSANPTATVASSTWYHVDVTDPGTGCTITDSVQVTTYPPVTATISGNQTVCQGSSANLQVTFTGTPPFNVTINGPGGPYNQTGIMTMIYNFSASLDGNYTITSVTGSGCSGTFSGTGVLDVIVPPSVSIGTSASYCNGDVIAALNVITSAGGTINWYDNAGLVGSLGTGSSYTPVQGIGTVTYYATETEPVLGCVGPADNVVITVNPIPPAPTWLGTTTYCDGDLPTPITGQPSLGGTITWYDNPPPATILSTLLSYNPGLVVGTFTIYITETANGCEGPETPITITVNPTPTAPAVTGDMLYCEGETPTALTATPTIGGAISWENSLGLNLATGLTYTPPLTIGQTDYHIFETLNGCTGAETVITVEVQAAPMVSVTPQVAICFGDSILINALNNGYTITWDDGQSGESVWLGPDSTTQYVVTATNPLCGFAQDSIMIIVNQLPDIIAGNDTLIGIGGEVTLWAESTGDVTFSWIPDVDECIEDDCSEVYDVPDQATVYVAIATDPIGCANSDTVLVDINGYMEIFVPNIFSPNGDGQNDLLEIKGPRLFNYYIQIYDRWGKVVFESTEQKEYWDGKLNGSDLAPQTFVYMLSGESVLGEKITQEGNVTIIK
jgi:gliding motility-associated-like protein